MSKRRLLLASAGADAALLLAEWLLGGPLRPGVHTLRDASWQAATRALHTALYQPDAELVYVPRPGARVQMDYGEAAFNAQGLRHTGPIGPPDGALRVLVLGDSLVWGELLPAEQALPAALQRALPAAPQPGDPPTPGGPGGIEVLNLGVTGYDTPQEAAWYVRKGRPLQPDVVVLVYCLNDMVTQSGPFEIYADDAHRRGLADERAWLERVAPLRNETVNQQWWAERGGEGSQVRAALGHAWRWHRLFSLPGGYVDDYRIAADDPTRIARTAAALHTLGDAVRADGAVPVLVISPALYWWHRYQWHSIHAQVAALGADAGFHIIDPLEAWAGRDPEPFRFPGDNLHYTAYGAEQLAAVIAGALPPAPLPPRAVGTPSPPPAR